MYSANSPAIRFITHAAKAKRNNRSIVGEAVRHAIDGHFKFAIGDITEIRRLHDLYDGEPAGYYAQAIKCGNDSFVKAYEADRGLAPWLWPTDLVNHPSEQGREPLSRLFIGAHAWILHKGKVQRYKVTGMDADRIKLAVVEEPGHRKKCRTCGQNLWNSHTQGKVKATLSIDRGVWQQHLDRFAEYRRLGVFSSGGVVSWELSPYEERTGPDEQVWTGTFLGGFNYQTDAGKVSTGLILKSRGQVVHGETLRLARGSRKKQLALWEGSVQYGLKPYRYHDQTPAPDINLDAPLSVAELKAAADSLEGWGSTARRRRLRGESVTIRQLLAGYQDYDLRKEAAYVRNLLDDHRRHMSSDEIQKQLDADRAAEDARLEANRETLVYLADSLDVGNCALGTRDWLLTAFPDLLPEPLRDDSLDRDSLAKLLRKHNRTLTVGQILDWLKANLKLGHHIRPVLHHAIQSRGQKV